MPRKDFPKTRPHRPAMTLPILQKETVKQGSLHNDEVSAMDSKRPTPPEKPAHAFHTTRMASVSRPLDDAYFEELRSKLRTRQGQLEATVLAVEAGLATKPIDVHRAMTHLETQGLADRAADIAFRQGNYQEAAAIYGRAGRYAEAGSACEIMTDYRNAALFYIRAACAQENITRGQRYLQRGRDLLEEKTDPLHPPKEFLQPSMSSRRRKLAIRDTTQTECTSIAAERCGLFKEAAGFARKENDEEMAFVYARLSALVEKFPVK